MFRLGAGVAGQCEVVGRKWKAWDGRVFLYSPVRKEVGQLVNIFSFKHNSHKGFNLYVL